MRAWTLALNFTKARPALYALALIAALSGCSGSGGPADTSAPPTGGGLPPPPDPPHVTSVTWVRETPHGDPDRVSEFVIRDNGTFELRDRLDAVTTVYPGRWRHITDWASLVVERGTFMSLDFDDIVGNQICGEAYGAFFNQTHLAIAYCGGPIGRGLEEGFYTSDPRPAVPDVTPPIGGQIAFVRDGRIHVANTDGSGLAALSAGPDDLDPAWSPDGSRIAFSRLSQGAPGIYVMDADGTNVDRLTTEGEAPAWSPDGQTIAFQCSSFGSLCKVRADGASAAELLNPAYFGLITSPTWSPDGTRIAHGSDWAAFDILFDIWVIAPDGSQLTPLITHTQAAPNPYEFYQPAWSPDGQRIAMVTCPWAWRSCSSSVISLMNADGAGITWLATTSGFARPAWSPDGQLIAFASSGDIEWIRVDGSERGRFIMDGDSPAWRP